MTFCFANALDRGCVLSVIPGRPPEGDIEGRRRHRTNGPLVIGFRSRDPAMIAARGFIWELSAHAAQRIERLTPREEEVFEDLVIGHSNRVIADKLSISPRTAAFLEGSDRGAHGRSLPRLRRKKSPADRAREAS